MLSTILNAISSKLSGFTNIDKAIAAFLGALGIQLDWHTFLASVDWSSAIKALLVGGPQAALQALIPAFLAWLAMNKPKVPKPEVKKNFT